MTFRCPGCGEDTRVTHTRLEPDNVVYRRRRCKSCGLSHGTIERLEYPNLQHRSRVIPWPMIERMRERYAEGGVTQAELAEEHGVSQASISDIIKRKTYKEKE